MHFLIADDHPLVRAGLKQLLAAECPECLFDEASDGAELLSLLGASQSPCDLILLDFYMPGNQEGSLIRVIRERYPSISILVLSACQEPNIMKLCLGLGASGFLTKQTTNDTLVSAIKMILDGGIYTPPELQGNQQTGSDPLPGLSQSEPESRAETLTPRQKQILSLLSIGHSNKQISRLLDLSENTVKTHVTAILRTLGVHNRIQAVIEAQKMGLNPSSSTL